MVRDPSSAHIAVAPQPATTNTVDIGPMYTTHASAAPVPDRSAAPISTSRMLMMKTAKALNGIETMNVGKIVTRATNQLWWMNSRQAKGGRTICARLSRDNAKKLPTSRSGLAEIFGSGFSSPIGELVSGGAGRASVATTSSPLGI